MSMSSLQVTQRMQMDVQATDGLSVTECLDTLQPCCVVVYCCN